MSHIIKRAGSVLLAMAVCFSFLPALDTAKAAMNDRTVEGSVPMPVDKTLSIPQGQEVKINFGTEYDYQTFYYFKIKPTKTGYINFVNDYTHGSSIALCNAKKKVISREDKEYDDFFSAGSSYKYQTYLRYGVKKGVNYYIRVKGASTERAQYGLPYIGTVKWTNVVVKGIKYGKTKKKGVVLKKKKKRTGLIIAGNKKPQWYKINSKQKKTRIYFSTKATNGTLYAEVYYKSFGKWYSNKIHIGRHDSYRSNNGYITSNKKKNTYYVKVCPKNSASGQYQIYWK